MFGKRTEKGCLMYMRMQMCMYRIMPFACCGGIR